MNWNLVRKTARERRRSAAIYASANALYVLFICAFFPSIRDMTTLKMELFKDQYQGVARFFGVQSFDIQSFNNYIVLQFLSLFWVIIMAAFVISFARNMVSGELEDGTLELLLSQPIERWNLLTSEGATLLCGIVSLVVTTILSIIVFGSIFRVGITYGGYLSFMALGTALFIAIAGYSIFFSALFKESRRAAMVSAGLTLAFYLLHFAGSYWSVADKIDWFGLFHYYRPLEVINGGGFPVKSVLVLLAFGVVGFAAALWVFRNKDIA